MGLLLWNGPVESDLPTKPAAKSPAHPAHARSPIRRLERRRLDENRANRSLLAALRSDMLNNASNLNLPDTAEQPSQRPIGNSQLSGIVPRRSPFESDLDDLDEARRSLLRDRTQPSSSPDLPSFDSSAQDANIYPRVLSYGGLEPSRIMTRGSVRSNEHPVPGLRRLNEAIRRYESGGGRARDDDSLTTGDPSRRALSQLAARRAELAELDESLRAGSQTGPRAFLQATVRAHQDDVHAGNGGQSDGVQDALVANREARRASRAGLRDNYRRSARQSSELPNLDDYRWRRDQFRGPFSSVRSTGRVSTGRPHRPRRSVRYVDGLGDRDRSLSPEGDAAWETLQSTLTPDPQPPSVGSSFASTTASAAASQTTASSSNTSITNLDQVEPPCDPVLAILDRWESNGEGDEVEEPVTVRGRSWAEIARDVPSDRQWLADSLLSDMQEMVQNLASRHDISDEWWAAVGLSRSMTWDESNSANGV